jgi:hypothetical protein
MRPFKRKSRLQRLLDTVKKVDLPGRPSDKTVKAGLIAAGGLTGLTAGSAGISSLRRRGEGAGDDS